MTDPVVTRASFSIPSIIAIIAALLSLFTGPVVGMILALVAVLFGIIGIVMALSPNVRGGFVSVLSVLAGGIGILVAIFRFVAWVF